MGSGVGPESDDAADTGDAVAVSVSVAPYAGTSFTSRRLSVSPLPMVVCRYRDGGRGLVSQGIKQAGQLNEEAGLEQPGVKMCHIFSRDPNNMPECSTVLAENDDTLHELLANGYQYLGADIPESLDSVTTPSGRSLHRSHTTVGGGGRQRYFWVQRRNMFEWGSLAKYDGLVAWIRYGRSWLGVFGYRFAHTASSNGNRDIALGQRACD